LAFSKGDTILAFSKGDNILAFSKGDNILRKKFTYKLYDFCKYGLLMKFDHDKSGWQIKEGSITRVHLYAIPYLVVRFWREIFS
jgi:hypothetical protein